MVGASLSLTPPPTVFIRSVVNCVDSFPRPRKEKLNGPIRTTIRPPEPSSLPRHRQSYCASVPFGASQQPDTVCDQSNSRTCLYYPIAKLATVQKRLKYPFLTQFVTACNCSRRLPFTLSSPQLLDRNPFSAKRNYTASTLAIVCCPG